MIAACAMLVTLGLWHERASLLCFAAMRGIKPGLARLCKDASNERITPYVQHLSPYGVDKCKQFGGFVQVSNLAP